MKNRYYPQKTAGLFSPSCGSARWLEAKQVRIGVARDITGAAKRAEAMQQRLYAISEAAHSARGSAGADTSKVHQVVGQLLPADNFFVALDDAANETARFPLLPSTQFDAPPDPIRWDLST